jgi:hypothetical protein
MRNEVRQDKLLGHDVLVIISGPFSICWRLRFLLAGISSYFKINLLPLQIRLN